MLVVLLTFCNMYSRTARLSASATSRISQVSSHIQKRNMASVTTHTLNTGAKIPALGFGTWQGRCSPSLFFRFQITCGGRARVYSSDVSKYHTHSSNILKRVILTPSSSTDKDDQEKAVSEALKAGYLHIDTAASMFLPTVVLIKVLTEM